MVVVVMGVSGSGKTTVGQALAARLGWSFEDADDLHPAANVEKMRHGIALTDEDREPWIRAVSGAIRQHVTDGHDVVLACSALRRRHRDAMRDTVPAGAVRFVYLKGTYEEIDRRLRARVGHFMPESLLKSQLDALDPPDATEALIVDVTPPVPEIVDAIVVALATLRRD
jgi:carbohydrate kinase, thermoresistant glucokinase family